MKEKKTESPWGDMTDVKDFIRTLLAQRNIYGQPDFKGDTIRALEELNRILPDKE